MAPPRRRAPPQEPPAPTGAPSFPAIARTGAIAVLVAGLAFVLLLRLARQAWRARLYSDECFHAYAAEWITRHGRLPVSFPEFYSGFAYYYTPLLHVLGAAWTTLVGAAALPLLNVALFNALILLAACPIVPGVPVAPRRWAVLLLLSSHWLALYAVRFYAEMLICLLVLAAVLLLGRFHATMRMRDAVGLGIASGLAVLAKHTGVVMPLAIAGCAVWATVARDPARRRGYAVALAIAIAIALPYFVRNAVLFGSPFYPMFARDSNAAVMQLNLERFSTPPWIFYRDALSAIGLPVLAMTAVALAAAVRTRRRGFAVRLMLIGLAVLAVVGLTPLHDVRHIMPLVVVLAVGASVALWEAVARQPRLAWAIEGVLLVVAALAVFRLGDLRGGVDLPPRLEKAYAAARDSLPAEATILSVWTYDTAYYTRRRATWPIPWSQRDPLVELFYERDPDRFAALLRRYRIDYMLVPIMPPPPAFNGLNYPKSFMDCVEVLGRRGVLKIVWRSETLVLIRAGG